MLLSVRPAIAPIRHHLIRTVICHSYQVYQVYQEADRISSALLSLEAESGEVLLTAINSCARLKYYLIHSGVDLNVTSFWRETMYFRLMFNNNSVILKSFLRCEG